MFNPQKFKMIRERANLSPAQVARLAGISRQFIQQWESGITEPRLEILVKLFGELGSCHSKK